MIKHSNRLTLRFIANANEMAPAKLACKNNEKFTYSGKEMSPLGLGYCADAEMVGSFMEGKDGKTWIVGVKNNEKVWIRYAEKKVLEPEANLINSPEPGAEAQIIAPEPGAEAQVILAPEAEPEANLIDSPEPGAEATLVTPEAEPAKAEPEKPKRKYTKKAKAESEGEEAKEAEKPKPKKGKAKKQAETGSETEEKPVAEPKPQANAEKPKRKYTKKTKQPDTETAVDSEAKPKTKRGPSGYNLYIGMKINEFRQNETGLKTTEYMKKAQEAWGAMSKEEQQVISAELKAAAAAKEA